MKAKDLEPYLLPGVIGIGILWIIGKFTQKEQQEQQTTTTDIITTGQIPSYSNTTYNQLADRIEAAGKSGYGTDEEAIYSVFRLLKKDIDYLKLVQAFGTRRLEFSTIYANLGGFLSSELSASEIDKVNQIMESKGLTARI